MNVKVIDFNVSKIVPNASELAVENNATKVGTPCYRAPELWSMASDKITQAVDCWGVGCILYTLLLGKAPFTDEENLKSDVKGGDFERSTDFYSLSAQA